MSQAAATAVSGRAGELRARMVRDLRELGAIRSDRVAAAFEAVPRHLFAPGESLERAYAYLGTTMPKRDSGGLLVSVLSAPDIQAMMLEPAGIGPGMRILEIGSGGVNAALIAELAGPDGEVTTVDIDPEITDRASSCLDAAGYGRVRVVLADAGHGVPDGAPYDRILVTAGAWDVAPAWISQLAPGGRLVVPLRFRGLTRTITFERDPDGRGLASRHYQLAAFVPFQGEGAHEDRKVMLRDGVLLHTDDRGLRIDAAALNAALDMPRLESWTGARYDFPDELSMFTTLNDPRVAQLRADQNAIDQGIVGKGTAYGLPALVTGDSIAYRAARKLSADPLEMESGVIAHGPHAEEASGEYASLLHRWAAGYCRRQTAVFRYLPGNPDPAAVPPGASVMAKRHGVLTAIWP